MNSSSSVWVVVVGFVVVFLASGCASTSAPRDAVTSGLEADACATCRAPKQRRTWWMGHFIGG